MTPSGSGEAHPDLQKEQEYVNEAYAWLARMRAHTEELLRTTSSGGTVVDDEILRSHLRERLMALAESSTPLVFGRIDEEDADRFYIGRRHVRNRVGDALVVDWRARAATPFYRATVADPMGVEQRRRFVMEGRHVVDLFDEHLQDPSADATAAAGVPDPLLAELGRARTGVMRDIVATIQAEQDEIIRRPLSDLIVVQGGPGTGKTAVGLHRAAFLLYEHRRTLERDKVLVIGPNRLFLSYISQVLPSLGERATYQTTVEGLVRAEIRAETQDPPAVERVKGDPAMAKILAAHCWTHVREPGSDIRARVGGVSLEIPRRVLTRFARDCATVGSERRPFREARNRFFSLLQRWILERYEHDLLAAGADVEAVLEVALRKGELSRQLTPLWPNVNPLSLVRDLLTSRSKLARAAAGLLEPDQQRLLQRRSARDLREGGWSKSDLPLIDEAEALVAGVASKYGHAIVDEAQDLSAMQLRMIARRCKHQSMTILGDLAQATTPGSQTTWQDVLRHLGAPDDASLEELSIGYRVPLEVMDFANRLLPVAAPGVPPVRSVRRTGRGPQILPSSEGYLLLDAAEQARDLLSIWSTVAILTPETLVSQVAKVLEELDIRFGGVAGDSIEEALMLLPASASKGLEFDAVVLVEPRLIMTEERGARRLYVALTRAVQQLVIVHETVIPAPLDDGEAPLGAQ